VAVALAYNPRPPANHTGHLNAGETIPQSEMRLLLHLAFLQVARLISGSEFFRFRVAAWFKVADQGQRPGAHREFSAQHPAALPWWPNIIGRFF
jgi:hypothetical protein